MTLREKAGFALANFLAFFLLSQPSMIPLGFSNQNSKTKARENILYWKTGLNSHQSSSSFVWGVTYSLYNHTLLCLSEKLLTCHDHICLFRIRNSSHDQKEFRGFPQEQE